MNGEMVRVFLVDDHKVVRSGFAAYQDQAVDLIADVAAGLDDLDEIETRLRVHQRALAE